MFIICIPLYIFSLYTSKKINVREYNRKLMLTIGVIMFLTALVTPAILTFELLKLFHRDQGEFSATIMIIISLINLVFVSKFTSKSKI
jgi:uncharacterized membrane protein